MNIILTGMPGSGKDENKRAPMYWTDDASAPGMASGPPGMDYLTYSFPPAIGQVGDPVSIYSYIREAVMLRGKYPHIACGSITALPMDNSPDAGGKSGAALRTWQGSSIIVAYNVSSEESRLTLQGAISDVLSATGEEPRQEGDTLILPGYCIVILAPTEETVIVQPR